VTDDSADRAPPTPPPPAADGGRSEVGRPGPGADPVTAVVLAGGDAYDALAAAVGAPAKALVPLKGRPLGAYVLDALEGAQGIRRIVWVGACDRAMRARVDVHVPGGPRLVDSLALGLGAALPGMRPSEKILILSADVPWLRGASVDRFLGDAGADHDLVLPVVARPAYEATFPGLARTWARLADGDVTGGNLLLGRPDALRTLLPWVDLATRDRKVPWRLAFRLGPWTLLSVALRFATLASLERRVARLTGLRVRALRSDDPVLGTDVDRIEHLPATLELAAPDLLEPPRAKASSGGPRP
jgi:molybdopterin-guanine dinucleotide biosynthesis protein A